MHQLVIVDDEPWVAIDLIENVPWRELGFEVTHTFTHPVEAYEFICYQNPTVAIVDIQMPILDGLRLIEKCKHNNCTSEFVILSAHRDFDYAKEAIRLDVVDYCTKPIDPDELIQIFSKLNKPLSHLRSEVDQTQNYNGKIDPIIKYIRQNIERKLTLDDISSQFFINKNYICDLFRKNLGTTFTQFITKERMELAKKMLCHTDLTLAEISKRIGINDEFYFNRIFKKYENIPPGLYRQLNQ